MLSKVLPLINCFENLKATTNSSSCTERIEKISYQLNDPYTACLRSFLPLETILSPQNISQDFNRPFQMILTPPNPEKSAQCTRQKRASWEYDANSGFCTKQRSQPASWAPACQMEGYNFPRRACPENWIRYSEEFRAGDYYTRKVPGAPTTIEAWAQSKVLGIITNVAPGLAQGSKLHLETPSWGGRLTSSRKAAHRAPSLPLHSPDSHAPPRLKRAQSPFLRLAAPSAPHTPPTSCVHPTTSRPHSKSRRLPTKANLSCLGLHRPCHRAPNSHSHDHAVHRLQRRPQQLTPISPLATHVVNSAGGAVQACHSLFKISPSFTVRFDHFDVFAHKNRRCFSGAPADVMLANAPSEHLLRSHTVRRPCKYRADTVCVVNSGGIVLYKRCVHRIRVSCIYTLQLLVFYLTDFFQLFVRCLNQLGKKLTMVAITVLPFLVGMLIHSTMMRHVLYGSYVLIYHQLSIGQELELLSIRLGGILLIYPNSWNK